MKELKLIEYAFNGRSKYDQITLSDQLTESEQAEVDKFVGKHWSSISCKMLSDYFEVINWFSPEAFCYFLPGIISAGIKESKPDLLIYDSIIYMLDRSSNVEYWDDFFKSRWTELSKSECEAVENWLYWLFENNNDFDDVTIFNTLNTIELLKDLTDKNQTQ